MISYTFTDLGQTMGFGKYSELSLEEVMSSDSSYIAWCIDNVSEFCMSPELIDEIKTKYPGFNIPEEFEEKILSVNEISKELEDLFLDLECDDDDNDYCDDDNDYGTNYGGFADSWSRYSEDDVINDAFEGDPDLYWNID